jgi:polar amino acid transport system substrate-binding protein
MGKKVVSYLSWFVFCLLTSVNVPSHAQTIKVVTEYLAPYQVKNKDGSLGGYGTEVVNRLFELTNKTPNIHILPWARAYRIALSEPNVLVYSMARTHAREHLFSWVGTLKTQRFYMWGLPHKFPHSLTSIEQAKQYRISVSKDYDSAHYLKEKNFPYLYFTTRDTQNAGMLLKERADIILSSESVLATIIQEQSYPLSQFKKLIEVKELNTDLSIAFSNNSDKKLVNCFKMAFNSLIDTGELAKMKLKWGIVDE